MLICSGMGMRAWGLGFEPQTCLMLQLPLWLRVAMRVRILEQVTLGTAERVLLMGSLTIFRPQDPPLIQVIQRKKKLYLRGIVNELSIGGGGGCSC